MKSRRSNSRRKLVLCFDGTGNGYASAAPGREEATRRRVLVVVHPGSCCGSATENLGRGLADDCRADLVRELDVWKGDVLVLDGALSDELQTCPDLDRALKAAVARAPHGRRIHACDDVPPHPDAALPAFLRNMKWRPGEVAMTVTGAWYDPGDRFGCVNGVMDILRRRGFEAFVADSVFSEWQA